MYIINTIYISQKEIQQEEDYEKTVEEKLWEEAGMETKEWLKETVCEKPKEAIFEKASSEPPKFEKAHLGQNLRSVTDAKANMRILRREKMFVRVL